MSLPWYVRPIEPSRLPIPWRFLAALFMFVVFAGTGAVQDGGPATVFSRVLFPALAVFAWLRLAWGVRRRRLTGQCPGFSIPAGGLGAVAVTMLAVQPLVWPPVEDQPVTTASLVVGCVAGALMAVAIYLVLAHTHRRAANAQS